MYPNAPEAYQKSSPQPQDIPTQAPPSAYPPQPQAIPTQAPPSAYPPQPQAIPTPAPPSAYPPQPIPFHHHDGITTVGQWSSGLCDCFDDPTNCFITCCCPCVTFGQIAEIVDKGTTSCAQAGAIYYLLASVGCACIYTCTYRSKLRGLYSLREDPCTDFLVHCCCDACALCQEYRELKKWGMDPSIGWQANAMRQGQSTVPPTVASGMTR